MNVNQIIENSLKINKGLKKDIDIAKNLKDEEEFIKYLEDNITNCFRFFKYSKKERDIEKKYIYCKFYSYYYYNIFMYIKEEYLNNFLLKKYNLEDISVVSKYYLSPLNYAIYMSNEVKSNFQNDVLKNLTKTEKSFIVPNIKYDITNIKNEIKDNKELYKLYISINRIESLYYRFHELIISKELDKIEGKLKKIYKKEIKEINYILRDKYDIEGFRR